MTKKKGPIDRFNDAVETVKESPTSRTMGNAQWVAWTVTKVVLFLTPVAIGLLVLFYGVALAMLGLLHNIVIQAGKTATGVM